MAEQKLAEQPADPVRRKVLKGLGAGIVVGAGWAVTHPWDVIGNVESWPGSMEMAADLFDKRAVASVKEQLPAFPTKLLERNPHYVPLIQQFQVAVTGLKDKGINPFWNYAEDFVRFDETKEALPSIVGLLNSDWDAVFEKGYIKFLRNPNVPQSLKTLLARSDEGIKSFLDVAATPGTSFRDRAEKVVSSETLDDVHISGGGIALGGRRVVSEREAGLLSSSMGSYWQEVRGYVEGKREIKGGPIQLSELIVFFGEKNKGNLVRAVADTYLFLRLVSRNDFRTGDFTLEDELGLGPEVGRERRDERIRKENVQWLKANIQDPIKFVDSNGLPDQGNMATLDEFRSLPKELKDNIDPVNQWGTLYHLFNTLFICTKCDYRAVMNMAIARTMGTGDLKVAREIAAVSEIPETLDFLNRLSR